MAYLLKLIVFTFLLAFSFSSMAESRANPNPNTNTNLAARLKLEGATSDCWGSLYELQACTGEVIMFFLNGETELGPNCCQAIRVIQQECWPQLLGSLGYTAEEGDILEAYCGAVATSASASPPPPSPLSVYQTAQPKNPVP